MKNPYNIDPGLTLEDYFPLKFGNPWVQTGAEGMVPSWKLEQTCRFHPVQMGTSAAMNGKWSEFPHGERAWGRCDLLRQ